MKKNKYDIFYKLLKGNDLYLPLCLCLGAFLIRFGFMVFSDNFKGPQSMLNIITSLHIFSHPEFMKNISYQQLPAFLYALFAAIKIGKDQIISGRLLSVFWGSLSILPFYYLILRIFNKRTAVFSAVLLCFYPAHIMISVITLPDIMGLFFLLIALFYVHEKKNVLSAFFLGISTACTYVSWLFLFILPVFIVISPQKCKSKGCKEAVKFFLIACLFAFFWIFITNNIYKEYNIFYKNFFEAKSFWIYVFIFLQTVSTMTRKLFSFPMPLLFLLGLAGVYQGAKKRKHYELFYLIGMLILTSALGVFRKEINLIEQGVIVASVLFIPFMITGLEFMISVFGLPKTKFTSVAVVLLCCGLLFLSIYSRPYLPQKVKNISCWLKDNIRNRNTELYISNYKNPYFSSIIMLSGLPQGNFKYYKNEEFGGFEVSKRKEACFIYSGMISEDIRRNFIISASFHEYFILKLKDRQ